MPFSGGRSCNASRYIKTDFSGYCISCGIVVTCASLSKHEYFAVILAFKFGFFPGMLHGVYHGIGHALGRVIGGLLFGSLGANATFLIFGAFGVIMLIMYFAVTKVLEGT